MKILSVVNLSKESPQSDSIANSPEDAVLKINRLLKEGADYVDIGGRSSGSKTNMITSNIERKRLAPVFKRMPQQAPQLSIDTWSIQTALTYLNCVDVVNYTSTAFPDYFLNALANSKRKLIISYLSAENPYQLRTSPCLDFNIDHIILFFEKTLALLHKKQVEVLAIDPNLGMWHPLVPDTDKPRIQQEIIQHIPILRKLAPVLVIAPRTAGTLNVELTKTIIEQGVDFIRTHDLKQIQACMGIQS